MNQDDTTELSAELDYQQNADLHNGEKDAYMLERIDKYQRVNYYLFILYYVVLLVTFGVLLFRTKSDSKPSASLATFNPLNSLVDNTNNGTITANSGEPGSRLASAIKSISTNMPYIVKGVVFIILFFYPFWTQYASDKIVEVVNQIIQVGQALLS